MALDECAALHGARGVHCAAFVPRGARRRINGLAVLLSQLSRASQVACDGRATRMRQASYCRGHKKEDFGFNFKNDCFQYMRSLWLLNYFFVCF
ncbi:hypothetical protein ACSFB7_16335 [Variovorax sp. GB1P17]